MQKKLLSLCVAILCTTYMAVVPTKAATLVDIGRSGGFTVYEEDTERDSGITVSLDALTGMKGDGGEQHSLPSFAEQNFTIEQAADATVGDVAASKVSWSTDLSKLGKLTMDTHVFKDDGRVGKAGIEWSIAPGDLKWGIELSSWTWTEEKAEERAGPGPPQPENFVDVLLSVKGSKTAQPNANNSFDMGDGTLLVLSDQIQIDGGKWTRMPEGFPAVKAQGSSARVHLRFPRFTTRVLYDSLMIGIGADATKSGGSLRGNMLAGRRRRYR